MDTVRIDIQPDGCEELWLLKGTLPDGFKWVAPITVTPFKGNGTRYYRVPATWSNSTLEYDTLCKTLDGWDASPDDNNFWWLKESKLKQLAVKAPGINPAYYRRWPGYEYKPETDEEIWLEKDQDISADASQFLRYLHNMTGEPGYDVLKIIWKNLQKWGMRWLAVEQKTLDLGFARLVPIPYRVNWKELLAVKFSQVLSAFKKPPSVRDTILRNTGFYQSLAVPEMLAINRFFARWTLETVPHIDYERLSEEHECAKLLRLGKAAYTRHVLRQMSNKFNEIMVILARYVAKVTTPYGAILPGGGPGAQILVPATKPRMVRPERGPVRYLDITLADPFATFQVEGEPENVPEALPDMPEMSRLFKKLKDVWGPGGIKSVTANGNGKARLRVHHVDKGEPAEQHLLGAGSEPGPGLADGSERS